MKKWIPISILALMGGLNSYAGELLMVEPGKVIHDLEFNDANEISKKTVGTRKETKIIVENGQLIAIPPVVAYEGMKKDTKWAKSSMSRINFNNAPKEYTAQFKFLHTKTDDKKCKLYIDLGHRCIRTTFGRLGTTLLIENHLYGKDGDVTSKVLVEKKDLKLEDDKWYDITVEVKGDEVLVQIDDVKLYAKDPLIAKNKPKSFNLDAGGRGFIVESMKIHEASSFKSDWESTKSTL